MKKNKTFYQHLIGGSLLLILLIFPLFGHLDSKVLRVWDESRLAVNAYEMNNNGDFIVTYCDKSPDMWNTKPPLMIWCQVFWMKIVGENELAVRLPSAIAALLTCCALLFFSIKYLKNFWFGWAAALVLVTIEGYVGSHGSRTGDYDALLTLFTILYCLSIFLYFQTKQRKYLYFFFIALTLSALTKGVVGFLFLPGLFIYALCQKELIPLLKNKDTYIGIGMVIFFVAGYYLLREHHNPGYLTAVYNNELNGRFTKGLEGHEESFLFYFEDLYYRAMPYWILFVPAGILVGLFEKDKKISKLTAFATLLSLTFLLIISISKTKLEWYVIPIFPFFSIIIAVFVYFIFQFLTSLSYFKKHLIVNVIPFIFLFFFFYSPYQKILTTTGSYKESPEDQELVDIEYFVRGALKGKRNIDDFILLYDGYSINNMFYINILNKKGSNVIRKHWNNVKVGDRVFFQQKNIKEYLESHYQYEVLSRYNSVNVYQIVGEKLQK